MGWKAQAVNEEGSVKIGGDFSTELPSFMLEAEAIERARKIIKSELKRAGRDYYGFRMSQAKHWSDVQLAKLYK